MGQPWCGRRQMFGPTCDTRNITQSSFLAWNIWHLCCLHYSSHDTFNSKDSEGMWAGQNTEKGTHGTGDHKCRAAVSHHFLNRIRHPFQFLYN